MLISAVTTFLTKRSIAIGVGNSISTTGNRTPPGAPGDGMAMARGRKCVDSQGGDDASRLAGPRESLSREMVSLRPPWVHKTPTQLDRGIKGSFHQSVREVELLENVSCLTSAPAARI